MDDVTLVKEPGLKKKLPVIVKCPHKNKHILESPSSDFPNLFSFADWQEGVGTGDGSAQAMGNLTEIRMRMHTCPPLLWPGSKQLMA